MEKPSFLYPFILCSVEFLLSAFEFCQRFCKRYKILKALFLAFRSALAVCHPSSISPIRLKTHTSTIGHIQRNSEIAQTIDYFSVCGTLQNIASRDVNCYVLQVAIENICASSNSIDIYSCSTINHCSKLLRKEGVLSI